MRYSKIEITGTWLSPYWNADEPIYQSSDLEQLGTPASETEDGLLFFTTEAFHRFILIPENHAFFNIGVLKRGDNTFSSFTNNNFVITNRLYRLRFKESELDSIFIDRYINLLYSRYNK